MLLPVALGLASAAFGAFSNIGARYLLGFTRTRDYLSVNFLLIFAMLLPLWPAFFSLQLSLVAIGLLVLASFIDAWANYFYFRSFEVNDAGTASTLLSLSPLFTLVFAPVFGIAAATHLGPGVILGVILVTLGVALLNRQMTAQSPAADKRQSRLRLLLPVSASLLFGVNVYALKIIFTDDYANPYTYYTIRALIIAVFMYLVMKPSFGWMTKKLVGLTAGRGLLVIAQWLLMLYALEMGSPAVVKAASEVTPLFVFALSFRLLREKVGWAYVLAAGCIVAGLVAITV